MFVCRCVYVVVCRPFFVLPFFFFFFFFFFFLRGRCAVAVARCLFAVVRYLSLVVVFRLMLRACFVILIGDSCWLYDVCCVLVVACWLLFVVRC